MGNKQFVVFKTLNNSTSLEENDFTLKHVFTLNKDNNLLESNVGYFSINDNNFKLISTNPEIWVYKGSLWTWYFEVINSVKNEFNEAEYDELMNF